VLLCFVSMLGIFERVGVELVKGMGVSKCGEYQS